MWVQIDTSLARQHTGEFLLFLLLHHSPVAGGSRETVWRESWWRTELPGGHPAVRLWDRAVEWVRIHTIRFTLQM